MTFSVSPGIYTKETDLSGIAEPFVGTNGCFAGRFRWGPCLERVRIANEETLGVIFGTPGTNIDNAIDFFVAAQYLSYSGSLDVVRSASFNGTTYLNKNAVAKVSFNTLGASEVVEPAITILNDNHYASLLDGDLEKNTFIARHTGELGNSIGISFVANTTSLTGNQYKFSTDFTANKNNFIFSRSKDVKYIRPTSADSARSILDLGDWLKVDDDNYQVRSITLDTLPAQRVISLNLVNGGSGYTGTPTVTFAAPGGSGNTTATGTVTLATAGTVKSVAITTPGSSYTASATGSWSTTGGGGSGATGTVTTDASGVITSVTVTTAGSGYTSAPTIVLSGIGAGTGGVIAATLGFAIASITIVNAGSGYATAPLVSFTGTGTGADFTSNIGTIDTITLDRLFSGKVSVVTTPVSVTNPLITTLTKYWRWYNVINFAPQSEGIHVIVFDKTGLITGTAGAIIEKYVGLSFYSSARSPDGVSSYWLNRINTSSAYIRIGTADLGAIPLYIVKTNPIAVSSGTHWISNSITLSGGADMYHTMGIDDDIQAYDLFKNPEETDAPIIVGNYRSIKTGSDGLVNSVLARYLIENIAEIRRDSVVFLSVRRESVVNNPRKEVNSIKDDAETLPSTSYAELDSGWKYIYDRYNDKYLWVPTSGDHAGCYARTDRNRDPWYSAAGEQRGLINNVVKLAFNPNESQRDELYSNRVNPIVSFPGIGTMIYGDKTLLSLSSGFNRIPTRRLFIVLERTLANAARFAMFEFNDNITRAQVYGILDAYLRDVKGRRGVDDYLIDVSDKVNTPFVVANNQFKGRIYIKPKYSINFIELNFINVGAILSFDEAVSAINNA